MFPAQGPVHQSEYIILFEKFCSRVHGCCSSCSNSRTKYISLAQTLVQCPDHTCYHTVSSPYSTPSLNGWCWNLMESILGCHDGTGCAQRYDHHLTFTLVDDQICSLLHFIQFQLLRTRQFSQFLEIGLHKIDTFVDSQSERFPRCVHDTTDTSLLDHFSQTGKKINGKTLG